MKKIVNINDPAIHHYKTLRNTPENHKKEKIFIAEGVKVVKRLLESNIKILSFFALEKYYEKYSKLISRAGIKPDKLYTADIGLMNEIVGFKLHAGIMAIGKQPDFTALNMLSNKIIFLNSIIDSENVGAIVRNCEAFGFDSLIYNKETSSPYLRRAVRVSMGGIFNIKIHNTDSGTDTLKSLKLLNYEIISAEVTDGAVNLHDFIIPDKYCLIFGSEGMGINQEILDISDHIVKIPIRVETSSINVAASSAIFMNYLSNK